MTVADLMELLKEYPRDSLVFMKSDPEGNSTHAAHDIGTFVGLRTTYGIQEYSPGEISGKDYDNSNFVKAVTIWPGYGESFDE